MDRKPVGIGLLLKGFGKRENLCVLLIVGTDDDGAARIIGDDPRGGTTTIVTRGIELPETGGQLSR